MKNEAYTTLIIDDEPPARARLYQLLENFPETFRVVDEAKNGLEAVEKIKQLEPDVIFLDIEMPGLNGFELLERLQQTVEKLTRFKDNLSSATVMSVLKEFYSQKEEKKMTSITVKKGDKLIFIKLDELLTKTAAIQERHIRL